MGYYSWNDGVSSLTYPPQNTWSHGDIIAAAQAGIQVLAVIVALSLPILQRALDKRLVEKDKDAKRSTLAVSILSDIQPVYNAVVSARNSIKSDILNDDPKCS